VIPESTTRPHIRVLIVDDSAFMRIALARMIASDPSLEVAGTARSGSDALRQVPALDPDVITLDVEMPGLDGLETLRRIMLRFPRPVIMVSSVTARDAEITFSALGAGAFDYVPKQLSSTSLDIAHIQQDLIAKIKAAAQSRLQSTTPARRKPPQAVLSFQQKTLPITPAIVAIGTSTGGPKALQEILPLFPNDLAVPILIVQHMPLGFTAPFAQRLNSLCSVPVREATHHDLIQPGVVYIAPAGMHMTVERPFDSRPFICLATEPGGFVHMPSATVLMQSVAATFHSLAMGVIMSGMGDDGSTGMAAIHREGGLTIGQDEASCAVYGMPRVCAELGVLNRVVPLAQIPQQILMATRYRMHA
jgi:two-component system, chemotaxis family, protein-glutamate methylesterase/glutaminase